MSESELASFGFHEVGDNVLVDRSVSVVSPNRVSIGSHVRIDAGTVISVSSSGMVEVGDHVHVGPLSLLSASSSEIRLMQFAGVSAGVRIFAATDDYGGPSLNNPTVPERFRLVRSRDIEIGPATLIGANSVLLPGAHLEVGAAVGALSVVRRRVPAGAVVAGNPARKVGYRSVKSLKSAMESCVQYLNEQESSRDASRADDDHH